MPKSLTNYKKYIILCSTKLLLISNPINSNFFPLIRLKNLPFWNKDLKRKDIERWNNRISTACELTKNEHCLIHNWLYFFYVYRSIFIYTDVISSELVKIAIFVAKVNIVKKLLLDKRKKILCVCILTTLLNNFSIVCLENYKKYKQIMLDRAG